uniref:MRH domain-containing protein n=1 Tax=Arion vulgaris TaxID=1028688 RepID=A0A0B7AI94_9EUPU
MHNLPSVTSTNCVRHILNLILSLSLVLAVTKEETLQQCHLDDFHYEYTECDINGGRWRVPVPKEPGMCIASSSPGAPVRGKDCNFACNPGEYLDIQGDQECHHCPPGTYSLGGGIRFDEWDELPSGFAVKTEHVTPSSWGSKIQHKENCSRSEWTPRGSYIMSVPGQCPSNLLFSAKLIMAGTLSFEYQYTDPESIFHFVVQNDQCQAVDSDETEKWPEITNEGRWSTIKVNLKTGMNVLQWRTIGALSELIHSSVSPVLIRKIEITGVAYTSECTKCPNGTYSGEGSSFCLLCPADQFSVHGANKCESCKSWEYAEPGSAQCTARPPCTEFDYYEYQKPCNGNGKTQMSFNWIEPRICYENASGSVVLPSDGPLVGCPPCNPGMHKVNASHCDFCETDHYADSDGMCHVCPALTSPNYNIDYKYWNVLPNNVSTHCISAGVDICTNTAGWLPSGDHIKTSFGLGDHNTFLVLLLKIAGFRGSVGTVDGKPIALSTVTFDMELKCKTPCQLLFLSDANGRNAVLQSWEKTSARKSYSHEIFTNESLTLTWAFQPDDFGFGSPEDSEQMLKMQNVAKIFNIKVTNVISGGATMCQSCPEGKTEDGCIPCPDGQYVDPKSQRCESCPLGTVLPRSNAWGKEACKPCGHGLHPVGGRSCRSDCHFTDDMGRVYDFTELDKVRFVSGSRLFTGSGTQYYHGFNISLCNHGTQPLPTCVNNVTSQLVMLNQPGFLSSMVCRSTLVPQSDPDKPLVSTQPVSLGTHLTKIVTNISLHGLYGDEGFPFEDTERDIHFYYESGSPTSACPNGRTSIISLRCDPSQSDSGSIQLPPKCSDGTCDGCTFHFLWLTVKACPTCRKEDYDVVRGECVNGEQIIHFFPPDGCLHLPEETVAQIIQKCTVLPYAVVIAIPVSVGVALILILLLIYCWSRNKKLEYKYMKLVETAGGQDGEMPAADTCGMEDDEEDVHFAEAGVSSSFLSKIREKFYSKRIKDDDNPFMAVKMSEKMSLT